MILIDKLSYSSKLRHKNPTLKFIFAVLTLLICVISRSITISLVVLLIMGSLIVLYNGTSLSYFFKLMTIPLVFLLLSTIAIIINFASEPLSSFAIPFFHWYITSSLDSLIFAARLILTALAAVSCLYFLSLTTPITDILLVLKKFHCPELLIELMLLIYRFIFVLLDLASALTVSQKSRLGNKDFKTACKSLGSLLAVLLVRSFQKSERLYDAMESRCYNGRILVLTEAYTTKTVEIAFVCCFELVLVALAVFVALQ